MPDTNCSAPSCQSDRKVAESVLTTKLNWTIALSSLAVVLLAYSVLWQAPTIRAEMAKEINRLDGVDRDTKADLDHLKQRVAALEK